MITYFKIRKPFSFAAHPFDIGSPVGLWKNYADNHFLLKVYKLDEQHLPEYYQYHLTYALSNEVCSEEDFFRVVWQIVENRIKNFEIQDPFSRNHGMHVQSIAKLKTFQKYLNLLDQWNARPSQTIILQKEDIIANQKTLIDELQSRLTKLNEYEVAQKIRIEDEHLATLIDLFQQIRTLELPSGRKLLRSDHKSPYSKMISKYFSHGGKDIPIETARNYFVEKKEDIPSKGTTIHEEHQIFKIIRTNEPEK